MPNKNILEFKKSLKNNFFLSVTYPRNRPLKLVRPELTRLLWVLISGHTNHIFYCYFVGKCLGNTLELSNKHSLSNRKHLDMFYMRYSTYLWLNKWCITIESRFWISFGPPQLLLTGLGKGYTPQRLSRMRKDPGNERIRTR